ncbi:MAG: aldehyde dehydrogenase family protein [Actinobacteria bacterium]|nr:aldehyde dehydrogenase family protein [Actinomycetota bacterium]
MTNQSVQSASLQELFDGQKQRVLADPLPTIEVRMSRLADLGRLLTDHLDAIREAITADFGSIHPSMVEILDTWPVLGRIAYFEQNVVEWMKPRSVDLGGEHGSSTAEVMQVPKGVNGIIGPWNFPIESNLVMAVDILAAGNTAIIKPSELAEATSQVLADAVADVFDPTVLAVVQGGAEVAADFAAMPWDHLTFTGSGRVGSLVMQAAAKNLVPVTLELGGKNPAVFAADGVTEELVGRFLSFRTLKAGQICTSPDYAMVPNDQLDSWVEMATDFWRKAYPSYVGSPDVTGIINDAHFDRVVGYISEADAAGVKTVSLNGDKPDAATRRVPLTLVINPPDHLGCMREEAFGPVVSVVGYNTIDDAMARINAGPSPLGAYLATKSAALGDRFAVTVRSGGTGINTFGLQGGHPALPFGGFGASGHGCHGAKEGFLNYSHTKSVFRGADDSFVHKAIVPPYAS